MHTVQIHYDLITKIKIKTRKNQKKNKHNYTNHSGLANNKNIRIKLKNFHKVPDREKHQEIECQ